MKILFIAAGSPATVFALTPLATAARNAGHQVFLAANDDMMPSIAGVGLPGIPLTPVPLWDFITKDRAGEPVEIPSDPEEGKVFTGQWFGRMAAAQLDRLYELVRHWRPDLVVGGTLSYAAALLAAELKVPYVRQAWDAIDATGAHPGADAELRPELRAFGLAKLPEPDLFVDVCPPSLRPADAPAAQMMRWIPGNGQQVLLPWMYARGSRPRVCLTSGSRVSVNSAGFDFLRAMVKNLAGADFELLVAAPEKVAGSLREEFEGIRTGWIPLDVVAPTLDLLVHHGGGTTTMTALTAGVPQLLMPSGTFFVMGAQGIADHGSGIMLDPDEVSADIVAQACGTLLTDSTYRTRAAELSAEISALPPPAEVVGVLERL
jgi:glycosyltransferase